MNVDNLKFLYEISRKSLDEEIERYKRLDEKAARLLTGCGIAIVAYTALVKEASTFICKSPNTFYEWSFIVIATLTYIALVSSWSKLFSSMRLINSPRIEIDDSVSGMIKESLEEAYEDLAATCQEATVVARGILVGKQGQIELAYRDMQFSILLISLSMIFMVLIQSSEGVCK